MFVRRSSVAARIVAVAFLIATFCATFYHSPAYIVKGKWANPGVQLRPEDYDDILEDSRPEVELPAIGFAPEGLAVSLEDSQLTAGFASKFGEGQMLELGFNEDKQWRAGLKTDDASLRVSGKGLNLDGLVWEASQSGNVEGVGNVLVEFNSDKQYNLTVSQPDLGEVLSTRLGAKLRATNQGFTGALRASTELPGEATFSYSVENPVGVYNLDKSHHVAEISAPLVGGRAALRTTREDSKQSFLAAYTRKTSGGQANFQVFHNDDGIGYNISFKRGLYDILPVDTVASMGVDTDGFYSKLAARRHFKCHGTYRDCQFAEDLNAEYEARFRATIGVERKVDYAHSLKLSNELGYVQFLQGTGGHPRVRLGYELKRPDPAR